MILSQYHLSCELLCMYITKILMEQTENIMTSKYNNNDGIDDNIMSMVL